MKKNNILIVVGNLDPEIMKENINNINKTLGAAFIEPIKVLINNKFINKK